MQVIRSRDVVLSLYRHPHSYDEASRSPPVRPRLRCPLHPLGGFGYHLNSSLILHLLLHIHAFRSGSLVPKLSQAVLSNEIRGA